jgi:putative transposase
MDYQGDEHRVHLLVYPLIWCPKRRKPVLVGPVATRCRALIEGTCVEQGWELLALALQPDHLHLFVLFVRLWPSDSAADVVKECKGVTSAALRREFPQLRKLPSMWTRSYFAATPGNVSQETIHRSIEAQSSIEAQTGK